MLHAARGTRQWPAISSRASEQNSAVARLSSCSRRLRMIGEVATGSGSRR